MKGYSRTVKAGLALLALLSLSLGVAQSVTVQLMTDASLPADLGSTYSLGQLNNVAFTYGPNVVIKISYTNLNNHSLSLSFSGNQPNYEFAWRENGSSLDQTFGSSLGMSVGGLSNSDTNLYYRSDGTLHSLSVNATRYQVGARSTPAASVDLNAPVTLTATLF